MSKVKLLDLYSGAGGAAYGYHRAGFEVTGVDHLPQPHYPFNFIQADALEYLDAHGHEYDVIHASPPCQAHTALKSMWNAREHPDLLPQTRAVLQALGKPYVIENVPGAPMDVGLMLCGTMFRLACDVAELRRHRLFESNMLLYPPGPCNHGFLATITVAGAVPRNGALEKLRYSRTMTITGNTPQQNVVRNQIRETFSVDQAREAMEIDWMTMAELSQAIPPAYTEWIGQQIMRYLRSKS